jgi:hypothetical protein
MGITQLFLTQSKWHESGSGSIEIGDLLKFIQGIRRVLDNNIDDFNDKIRKQKTDIEHAIYSSDTKIVIVIAYTGSDMLSNEAIKTLDDYITSQNDTSEIMIAKVLNQNEVYKAVSASVKGDPISLEVHISEWGQTRDPHYAIYGQICASDVASWFSNHGARLFEKNLRYFIGSSTVNQDIVSTLSHKPINFWYFNNGITAIATSISKKPIGGDSKDFGLFECSGFCVVNGAQTVGSIFQASEQNKDLLAKARVQIRIISIGNDEQQFCTEVTRYTNTQNSINKQDFVALDPEQERLQKELFIDDIEYAYKAGSSTGSDSKRFDLPEATIALACSQSEPSLAVQAKREISKLWDDIELCPFLVFEAAKGVTYPVG